MPPRSALPPLLLGASLALAACKDKPLPPPDPQGKDIVPGAIVAAVTTGEATPGVRTYKIRHVYNLPLPIGERLEMIAYDPKAPTFEDAARAWKAGGMQVLSDHVAVQTELFLKRDHRVIGFESVIPADAGAASGAPAASPAPSAGR